MPPSPTMRPSGFEATDRFDRLSEPDAILICVPTPLTECPRAGPDAIVVNSAHAIAAQLRAGPTRRAGKHDLPDAPRGTWCCRFWNAPACRPGRDFFLAFSPEREDPGNANFSVNNIPKVVGGLDAASSDAAVRALLPPSCRGGPRVSTPEVAEACKILENTYRAVNIALVNELKVLYDRMGIDVWEVIDAAKTKPFGFQAFYPGPGLGGHCIPIDPFYLTWVARQYGLQHALHRTGRRSEHRHAGVRGRRKVADALNDRGKPIKGSKIAFLGMAYKKDVDDPRESPCVRTASICSLKKGADVSYNDPHIPALPRMRHWPHLGAMASTPLTAEYLREQDCVLIATDHSAYDYDWIVANSRLVVDTRNATRRVRAGWERVIRA